MAAWRSFQSAPRNPQSEIISCASRLFVLPLSSAFADILRCRDAGAGTARFRARDRFGVPPAHKLAARTYRLFARAHSLRAAARNLKDFRKEGENGWQMAARPG